MHHGPNLIAVVVIILVLFGIDYYVFQGVKVLTVGLKLAKVRQVILIAYWVLSFLIVANVFLAFLTSGEPDFGNRMVKFAMNTFIIVSISKLAFLFVLFGEDIYRGFAFVFNKVFNSGSQIAFMPDRRKFISQAGILLAAINFSSLLYGSLKGKYKFKVHRHTLYFKDLPDSFDGFTITQLSDIHIGSFREREEVEKGIEMALAQKSDLFVFSGDMVNNKADELKPWMKTLAKIKAPYGQYSVLGNHDYGDYVNWKSEEEKAENLERLKAMQEEMGFKMLINESVKIEKDGENISLIGVENWGEGFVQKGDLNKALDGLNGQDFKILLSHDPTHWDAEVKAHPNNIHLTLSGHTHGMQMGIETPYFKISPVRIRYKNWAGLVSENGKNLYVNRGFGHIAYSGRVGIWPEIAVIELRKG